MKVSAQKFNGILKSIKSNDAKVSQLVQQGIEFCFEQAGKNENLSPIDRLLSAVGSSRTLRHQQIKAYILAHLSNIVIGKTGTKKKAKGKPIDFTTPSLPWWEYGRNELEKAESHGMAKVKLDLRLEAIIKAVANGATIEIKDKDKVKNLIHKLEELVS